MTTAATILKDARHRAGLTQTELGEYAGVAQSVVSAYESGKREPSLRTLKRLVTATGFELEITLQDTVKPSTLREKIRIHRDELLAKLSSLGATNVRLFGSVARGDERSDSDIDLLVDLREGAGLFALARMETEAERILGTTVDIVPANSLKEDVAISAFADAVAL